LSDLLLKNVEAIRKFIKVTSQTFSTANKCSHQVIQAEIFFFLEGAEEGITNGENNLGLQNTNAAPALGCFGWVMLEREGRMAPRALNSGLHQMEERTGLHY